jgi:multiple sugar transport system substrate-binding protein
MTTSSGFPFGPTRRRGFLKTGAALGLGLGLGAGARAESGFDWKRFKGEKIEVLLAKSPRSDVLQKYEKEFTELTGITVGSEQVPEQQQRQKAAIEFASGATSFDALMLALHVQKRLAAKGGWLADLKPLLADPTMTAPDFDFQDFSEAGRIWATQADGKIDTFPINIDYHLVYYNKDLFQAAGLAFPQTYDEMLQAAKALTDPGKGRFGWVSRGLKNANVVVWTNLLLGWDVDSIDQNAQMHTDGQPAVEAAQLYTELNAKYGPPGLAGFNWMESQASFMQGRVGMWLDGIGFAPPLEDPKKSRIAGKVGYGIMPKGPKARHSGMFADGMGVSASSKKQGPAYFYVQWATSKPMLARMLATGSGVPPRNSAFQDQAALQQTTASPEFVQAAVECGKIGRPSLPVIVPVTEFRDTFGVALTNMLGGSDPAAELKKATEQFRPVLEKSERA